MYLILSVVFLALVVGALVDIITRPEGQVKHLPKVGWIILVILLPLIGSLVWFMAGRGYTASGEYLGFGDPRRRESRDAEQPYRAGERGPRTTEQELADLDAEIEFHEKQARIDRLEARLVEKRERPEAR